MRARIRFRRKCSDIPRNLFASGGISVVFGNAGGCVIFDSRGRDDDKTSPSRGLDPLCASIVIRFLFLLLRGYPPIIGKLTDRLNFSSLLLHQQQHQIHQVVSLLGHLQLGHQKAGLVRPGVESQAREGYGPQLLR